MLHHLAVAPFWLWRDPVNPERSLRKEGIKFMAKEAVKRNGKR